MFTTPVVHGTVLSPASFLPVTLQVLFAIGRDASTSGMGLEAVGVQLDKYGDWRSSHLVQTRHVYFLFYVAFKLLVTHDRKKF